MLHILLSMAALAQSAGADLQGNIAEPDIVRDLAAPPRPDRSREILCSCKGAAPAQLLLKGLVIDAEVTLGPDGRSANDRQATFFNVLSSREGAARAKVSGRTKVYHNSGAARCGVQFDYGKSYSVPVRKNEAGNFETDFCLMTSADAVTPAAGPKSE